MLLDDETYCHHPRDVVLLAPNGDQCLCTHDTSTMHRHHIHTKIHTYMHTYNHTYNFAFSSQPVHMAPIKCSAVQTCACGFIPKCTESQPLQHYAANTNNFTAPTTRQAVESHGTEICQKYRTPQKKTCSYAVKGRWLFRGNVREVRRKIKTKNAEKTTEQISEIATCTQQREQFIARNMPHHLRGHTAREGNKK